jgi:hypothetical protein
VSGRLRRLLGRYWPAILMIAIVWIAWLPVLWKSGPAPSADRVRGWLDTWGISASVSPETDANHWSIAARLAQSTTTIVRTKQREDYLILLSVITLSTEHLERYKTLSRAEAETVDNELQYALAFTESGLTVAKGADNSGNPTALRYTVERRIPINWALDEAEFMRHVDAHERAVNASKIAIRMVLDRLRPAVSIKP